MISSSLLLSYGGGGGIGDGGDRGAGVGDGDGDGGPGCPVAVIVGEVVVGGGDLATRDVEPLALVLAAARFARSRARRF